MDAVQLVGCCEGGRALAVLVGVSWLAGRKTRRRLLGVQQPGGGHMTLTWLRPSNCKRTPLPVPLMHSCTLCTAGALWIYSFLLKQKAGCVQSPR